MKRLRYSWIDFLVWVLILGLLTPFIRPFLVWLLFVLYGLSE
jgi:hypothetical protein